MAGKEILLPGNTDFNEQKRRLMEYLDQLGDQQISVAEFEPPFEPGEDRIQLSLANLLSGQPGAAGRALLDPKSLSPKERQTIADRLGLPEPFNSILEITLNPIVLSGLLLTVLFPMPFPDEVVRFSKAIARNARQLSRFDLFAVPSRIFKNVGRLVPIMKENELAFKLKYKELETEVREAIEEYKKATGGNVSQLRLKKIAAYMDGLGDPSSQMTEFLRGVLANEGILKPRNWTPVNVADLTETDLRLASRLRKLYDRLPRELLDNPNALEFAHDILTDFMGLPSKLEQLGTALENPYYLPHVAPRDVQQAQAKFLEYTTNFFGRKEKLIQQKALQKRILAKVSPNLAARNMGMIPNVQHLRELGVEDDVLQVLQGFARSGRFKEYSLDIGFTTSVWADRFAKMAAWAMPTPAGGPPIGLQLRDELARIGSAAAKAPRSVATTLQAKLKTFQDLYLPKMLGMMTDRQLRSALAWEGAKYRTIERLESGPLASRLPNSVKEPILRWLSNDRTWTLSSVSHGVAGLFWVSTLGLSVPQSLLNLTQAPITLIGIVGPKSLLRGYGRMAKGAKEYLRLRMSGLSGEAAFDRAFQEFSGRGLHLSGITRTQLQNEMDSIYRAVRSRPLDKIQDAFMFMFQTSETSNRVAAFYAANDRFERVMHGRKFFVPSAGRRLRLQRGTPEFEEAKNLFADEIVNMTQFGSGILNTPLATVNLNPLLRQFTTFPIRMTSLAVEQLRENPGLIGRSLLLTGATAGVARKFFGVDLSRIGILGATPAPSEGLPFSPLPVVPPILQLAGAALNPKEFGQRSLQLLIPGGVALARALPNAPAPIGELSGKLFRRNFVDTRQAVTDEQGITRYPMFTPGGSLVGYFSAAQLFARALGIRSLGPDQEVLLTQYLLAQRDRVRQMKRDYLSAIIEGDYDEAERIQLEYERAYPGTGGLPIRKSDINAVHLRRDVSRIERIMQTLPKELRPQFQMTVAVALGNRADLLLGLDQMGILRGTTIMQRDKYRVRPRPEVERILSQGLHSVKLRDKMRRLGLPGVTAQEIVQSGEDRVRAISP